MKKEEMMLKATQMLAKGKFKDRKETLLCIRSHGRGVLCFRSGCSC